MIKNFKKHKEILLVFLASLTPLWWLRNGEAIIGHDSGFRLNYLNHLINLFYSWNFLHNFGTDWGILKGFLVIQFPETFFSVILGSLAMGQKAAFVFWFFVMGISMYIFIRNFFPQKEFWIMRIFGSIFHMYNFFILQAWFIAERAKFSLFAALPLGLLIIYKTLNKQYSLVKGTILFSILSFFLNGGGSPPLYGSLILVYGLTFVFVTILNIRESGFKAIVHTFKTVALFALGFLSINAYFILPQIYTALNGYSGVLSSIGGISGILAWENAINKYASVLNLIRLQGIPDWYDNPSHSFSYHFINNPALIVLSFVPILLILFGLFFQNRKDMIKKQQDLIHLLFIVLFVGIVFAGGSHPPFGFIYIFLVEHIPGFAIFRSAIYKFGPAVWFSLILLSSFYLNLILNKFIRNKIMFNMVGFFVILILLVYHFPFFNSNFFQFNKPFVTKVSVPNYVYDSNTYLNSLDSSNRLILIPKLDPLYKVDSYGWGFWSLEPLSFLSLNNSVVSNDTVAPEIVNQIYKATEKNNSESFTKLLGRTGINKILVRNDIIYSNKSNRDNIIQSEKKELLENKEIKSDKIFGEWEILNVNSSYYLPLFYSPLKIISSNLELDSSLDLISNEKQERILSINEDVENAGKQGIINKISNQIYNKPECILCSDREYESMRINLLVPKANVLPGSIFYRFKISKENKLRSQVTDPAQKIDLNLAFSHARISEFEGIFYQSQVSSKKNELKLQVLSQEYKELIGNALKGSNQLEGLQNDKYKYKLAAYLYSQKELLETLYTDDNGLRSVVSSLTEFVNANISLIEKDVWRPRSLKEKNLVFNIEEKDSYELKNFDKLNITSMLLDEKEIELESPITLDKGEHRLRVNLNDESSEVLDQRLDEFSLANGHSIRLNLKDIGEYDKYLLTFEYKTSSEAIIETLTDHDMSVNSRFNVYENSDWELVSQELKNNSISPNGINLIVKNISKNKNNISIRNLKLTRKLSPKIYLFRNIKNEDQNIPNISFKKINPTHYVVNVTNARGPFFLNFGNSFSTGWKAYVFNRRDSEDEVKREYFNGEIKELKSEDRVFDRSLVPVFTTNPIPEVNHIKSNGFSNAWYVDGTGDFEIAIFYEPQKAFYIGIIISIVTLFVFVLILLKLKHGKN